MISPMLAVLGSREDLVRKGYFYEPKLDGTRAIGYYSDSRIRLVNRRDRDITYRYPEFDFSRYIKADCILDGEVVVFDQKGNPSFSLLQKREHTDNKMEIKLKSLEVPATYVVFDIIEKDGKSVMDRPLSERKEILDQAVKDGETIQKMFFTQNGKKLWREITRRKLEGVLAKSSSSSYYPGRRSPEWIKIKFLKTIDCVIIGYVHKIRAISSLAVGVYDKGKMKYIGKVGTGFTEAFLDKLAPLFKKLETRTPQADYKGAEKIYWVKPRLVCEVRYLEFSKDSVMRAPAFLRLREDKDPRECSL